MMDMTPDSLLDGVQEAEVMEVCRQLVRTRSVNPPGNELEVAQYVASYLARAGLSVELVEHTPERASVLARLAGAGERPSLLFSAHLDTVPVGAEQWLHPPFDGVVDGGKLYGRGSSDMKGGLAAAMVAARVLAEAKVPLKGDFILAATAGEEVDSLGATAIAGRTDLLPVQALIVAEPSSNEIFVAEKGALWLEVATFGKTAHGSMPDLGRNAVMMMVRFLAEFEKLEVPFEVHPLLGGFSRSVNTITGGVKTNVVPDYCAVTIDMRTVPGQDHRTIVAGIEGLLAQLQASDPSFRAEVRVVNDRQPVTTAVEHPAVEQFNAALAKVVGKPSALKGVRYYTDAAAFVPVMGVPMIICGPGEAGLAHQPNEYVEVSRLTEAARIYVQACLEML